MRAVVWSPRSIVHDLETVLEKARKPPRSAQGDPAQTTLFGTEHVPVKAHVRQTEGGPVLVMPHTRAVVHTKAPAPAPAPAPGPDLRRWDDDDPAAPWNQVIRWKHEPNEGAHWYPEGDAYDSLVVEKRPKGYRARGLYAVLPIIARKTRDVTAGLPLVEVGTLDEVRAYLREHWRLNNRSPEEQREADRVKAEAKAKADAEAEVKRAKQAEQDRLNNEFRAEEAKREAARVEHGKQTGDWMNEPRSGLKPAQKAQLLAALEKHGLPLSASFEVAEIARMIRGDKGETWARAYDFAAAGQRKVLDRRAPPTETNPPTPTTPEGWVAKQAAEREAAFKAKQAEQRRALAARTASGEHVPTPRVRRDTFDPAVARQTIGELPEAKLMAIVDDAERYKAEGGHKLETLQFALDSYEARKNATKRFAAKLTDDQLGQLYRYTFDGKRTGNPHVDEMNMRGAREAWKDAHWPLSPTIIGPDSRITREAFQEIARERGYPTASALGISSMREETSRPAHPKTPRDRVVDEITAHNAAVRKRLETAKGVMTRGALEDALVPEEQLANHYRNAEDLGALLEEARATLASVS